MHKNNRKPVSLEHKRVLCDTDNKVGRGHRVRVIHVTLVSNLNCHHTRVSPVVPVVTTRKGSHAPKGNEAGLRVAPTKHQSTKRKHLQELRAKEATRRTENYKMAEVSPLPSAIS